MTVEVSQTYQIRCIGLHLKSKREVPEADQQLMRLNEARLARKHVDTILKSAPETNLIVTGDLNALRHEPSVKLLQGIYGEFDYLAALPLADPYGQTWTHYWNFADVYSRFDFALYSKGLSPEIDRENSAIHHWPDWYLASDHRPLVISIRPDP